MDIKQPRIDSWKHDLLVEKNIALDILRLDELHPYISGNKYFKLIHHYKAALQKGCDTLLTFGGAYSNHLHATAYFGMLNHIRTIGIVRGQELSPSHNATLNDCHKWGMELIFIDRNEYSKKENSDVVRSILSQVDAFTIPEGGSSALGVKGSEMIASFIPINYDIVSISVGSGTTMAGVINGLNKVSNITSIQGFAPMKSGQYLLQTIESFLHHKSQNYSINDDYHFGGFGKYNNQLIEFIKEAEQSQFIPLDIVYTGKMLYALMDLIAKDFYPKNTKILAIHSGGLQGNRSFLDIKNSAD